MLTNEQKAKILNRIKRRFPDETDAAMLEQLVDDAGAWTEAYTNRTTVPDALVHTVGDLAIISYNRAGTEGDAARSEGGESYTFETAPASVYDVLRKYRIARCGGHAHEAKPDA